MLHIVIYYWWYYLQIVVGALSKLSGELAGKYYPLSKMTEAEQEQLINASCDANQ